MVLRKLFVFAFRPPLQRCLLIEAYLCLAWARILKAKPFKNLVEALEVQMDETAYEMRSDQIRAVKQISWALHLMRRYAFWESQCLVMALAAMKMLARRGIDSTLYMGTAKDQEGRMIAHAWLRSGPVYVTGAEEMEKYAVVSRFAKRAKTADRMEAGTG